MVTGTLEDSEAARDFASLLPLSLTLEDYFHYSSDLVRLGTLDSGSELLRRPGSYEATIRKLER